MAVVTKFLTNSNGKMLVDSTTGKPLSLAIDVVNGTDGEDGDSVFIRYSASSNGSNMTAEPAENTRYIGFYRGQSASNTASDYTWSQYVGKEISEVAIDEFSFVITYDDGTTSTAPLNTENCLVTYAVPSGEATAVTAYLAPSNADLNDYRGENYWGKTYYAGGSNTVQNTPVAGIAFSLEVLRSGAFATVQRITMTAAGSDNQPTIYTRSVSDTTATGGEGTWTAWTEVAESNGIANTYATKSALSSETTARGAADTALGGRIDDIVDGTTTVANATKATQDGNGRVIASTYATQSGNYSGLTAGDLVLSGKSMNPTLSNGIININMPSTTGIYLVTVWCTITVSNSEKSYVCYGSTLLNVQALGVGMGFLPVYDTDGLVGFLGLSGYLKHQSPGLAFYNLSLQKQTISKVTLPAVTQQALAIE